MALANGVLGWHRNSAFAGNTGAPLTMSEGGYSRFAIKKRPRLPSQGAGCGQQSSLKAPLNPQQRPAFI